MLISFQPLLQNSTASSGLNSIAAVTLQDIVRRVHPDISDVWATKISKIIGNSNYSTISFHFFHIVFYIDLYL